MLGVGGTDIGVSSVVAEATKCGRFGSCSSRLVREVECGDRVFCYASERYVSEIRNIRLIRDPGWGADGGCAANLARRQHRTFLTRLVGIGENNKHTEEQGGQEVPGPERLRVSLRMSWSRSGSDS